MVTGLSSGTEVSFSFATMFSALIGREHKIAIDDHADRKSRSNCKRRLDIEVAAHDQLARLVQAVDTPPPERRHDGIVVAGSAELGADAEQCGKRSRPEQPAPVVIDVVLEAGKSLRIGAGLALQHDRAAIRHDQPRPDQEHAILAERNLAVVGADQLRSLRAKSCAQNTWKRLARGCLSVGSKLIFPSIPPRQDIAATSSAEIAPSAVYGQHPTTTTGVLCRQGADMPR
jgi:hypothetical protein